MKKVKKYIKENNWVWAAVGAFLLWFVMGISSGRLNLESFLSNAYTAAFLAILAFGQMLVVTSGRGATRSGDRIPEQCDGNLSPDTGDYCHNGDELYPHNCRPVN